ncbi:hypothetical protein ScPMuIL_010400 [Solemya velum]
MAETDESEVDLHETLALQLAEVEMLGSMYPADNEFVLDDPCAVRMIQSYLNGQIKEEYLESRIGFTLRLFQEKAEKHVEMVCRLQHDYPVTAPVVFVRSSQLCRENHHKMNEDMNAFMQGLEKGEMYMLSVIQWLQDNLEQYLTAEKTVDKVEDKNMDTTLNRIWIYSHHLFSKIKRKDILDWADELNITGFSMPGKPGIICAEGFSTDVDEFWFRIRRMTWKRIALREKEEIEIGTDDIKNIRKFSNFEEKVFDVRCGKGREYHMDLGKFCEFLDSNGCRHLFNIFFGVDGKVQNPD